METKEFNFPQEIVFSGVTTALGKYVAVIERISNTALEWNESASMQGELGPRIEIRMPSDCSAAPFRLAKPDLGICCGRQRACWTGCLET